MSKCHLCAFEELPVLQSYELLRRVTSDCKPWPSGGQLGVCPRCGSAQAVISPQWEKEAREIYGRYTIYHQSSGAEQSVFEAATGAASSRSARLLQRLNQELPLPSKGRLLDVGCGNGSTLRVFNRIAPGWSLAGFDVTDHYKVAVESSPGVECLFTGTISEVRGQFDVITLIHSLEHIARPVEFLVDLRSKLRIGGTLVIQVPDCWRNPFMFLVADHATHFFQSTLRDVVAASGYEITVTANDWIAKELTLIARRPARELPIEVMSTSHDNLNAVRRRTDWLVTVVRHVRALAAQNPLGILGTSIAATWLQEELAGRAAFFVDEDPNRFGQEFMGRQVLRPSDTPAGSHVIIALPTPTAEEVCTRLAAAEPKVNWLVLPALPA